VVFALAKRVCSFGIICPMCSTCGLAPIGCVAVCACAAPDARAAHTTSAAAIFCMMLSSIRVQLDVILLSRVSMAMSAM
jgi:hypothetical protein